MSACAPPWFLVLKKNKKESACYSSCFSAGALDAGKPIKKPQAHGASQIKNCLAYFNF
jgi:hypothetical protein